MELLKLTLSTIEIEASGEYKERIQFFIPTNDAFLIESLQGKRKYINLYSTPATSKTK